jgi:8-oxo-dGTP pyrophosphatase MutT (NUDIX family)
LSTAVPLCPHCAAPAERPLLCQRCGWRWVANPFAAAGVLIERMGADGEPSVLLLRRAIEPGLGDWDLPAGYLDPSESAEEGALREASEEAGLPIELVALAGVYSTKSANVVASVFLARPLDPEPQVRLDFESSDYAWVSRADVEAWLPRMAFRSMALAVADWAAGRVGVPRAGQRH